MLLQSRPEVAASDDEYAAFVRLGGLQPDQLVRVRLDQGQLPDRPLGEYCAILMGGGPANFAYAPADKSAAQRRFEAQLLPMMAQIVAEDIPFLGACLGVGALVTALGGRMSFDHGEPVGAPIIRLTAAAAQDRLLAGLPDSFQGFVGHKEGVVQVPAGATVLARSDRCVQMLRVGQHVYATQFHPELDAEGLALRIEVYKHAGYFAPDEAAALAAQARRQPVSVPMTILRRFVQRYRSAA